MDERTHASFFSGVGGLDLGLERAGWRTVSFSEIDPYASAVLAERWPGIPNLGDIVALAAREGGRSAGGTLAAGEQPSDAEGRRVDPDGVQHGTDAEGLAGAGDRARREGHEPERRRAADGGADWRDAALWTGGQQNAATVSASGDGGRTGADALNEREPHRRRPRRAAGGAELRPDERPLLREDGRGSEPATGGEWHRAFLWTGGFPCQDLSVAGKRRGFAGERSSLAFAFLALVERYRPPAILLENVPGLLSSHGGRDMARLVGEMAELGYGVAYRVLDARHFGVPQRRRRVFILGLRSDPDDPSGRVAAERAAAVLAVGTRCRRHPAAGGEARADAPAGAPNSPDGIVGQALSAKWAKRYGGPAGDEYHNLVSPSPDSGGVRAADGLAGRLDGGVELVTGLTQGLGTGGPDAAHAAAGWPLPFVKAGRAQTADDGETWTDGEVMPTLSSFDVGDVRTTAAIVGTDVEDDPLLPLGLDSHRYRCCGNGVVANVAEWIGHQLMAALQEAPRE